MCEFQQATDLLKQATNVPMARLALGKLIRDDGMLNEALEEFRAATRLNRQLADAWENIAWTILMQEGEENLAEAETAARRAVQLEKLPELKCHRYAVLARCLMARNKNDLALKEALKAVQEAPNQPQAHIYLAQIQLKLGMHTKACQSAQHVLKLKSQGEWAIEAEQLLGQIERSNQTHNNHETK